MYFLTRNRVEIKRKYFLSLVLINSLTLGRVFSGSRSGVTVNSLE